MDRIIRVNTDDASWKHRNEHPKYEYYRQNLIPSGEAKQCTCAVYRLPPKKANFPYHYHLKNEESFFIISGEGILRTPEGERKLTAGDFVFFPAGESGAHQLRNASETELLVYLDYDTDNDLEVCFYPDSGKIGVYGETVRQLYRTSDQVEYYEGE
ncbi:MAG: cupin domain-containing protein [Clostridiaceae bacterium]